MDSADEPDWARLLRALYAGECATLSPSQQSGREISEDDPIHDRVDLTYDDVDDAVEYLHNAELLDHPPGAFGGESDAYQLTSKGFDVAHQRAIKELEERLENQRAHQQNKTNLALVYLTLGLVLVALFDVVVAIYQAIGVDAWRLTLVLFILSALVISIYSEVKGQGLLSIDQPSQPGKAPSDDSSSAQLRDTK